MLNMEKLHSKCSRSFPELEGGKFFFNTVKEGDNITLATEDENERTLWVQAIYRATGQTHKPVPPVVQTNKMVSNTQISRMQGGKFIYRATGQTHKPLPPVVQTNKMVSNTQISRMQGGKFIYRATGQTHKPVPPVVQTNKMVSNTQISRMQGGKLVYNVL